MAYDSNSGDPATGAGRCFF